MSSGPAIPPGPVPPAEHFPPDDLRIPPGPWRRRRFPVWLPFAAALAVVLGGLAGWYLTSSHGNHPPASAHASSAARPSAGGGSAQAASAEPSGPQPSPTGAPASPTPAATATPGSAGSGDSAVVALSPSVAGQPGAGAIAAFLGQYFTAINNHDYQAYIGLLTPAAQQNESSQKFSSGYATTRDSHETLAALSPAHQGKTAASVAFVSHQAPADSYTHTACTVWAITLFLKPTGTSYLIGVGPGTYRPSAHACS